MRLASPLGAGDAAEGPGLAGGPGLRHAHGPKARLHPRRRGLAGDVPREPRSQKTSIVLVENFFLLKPFEFLFWTLAAVEIEWGS